MDTVDLESTCFCVVHGVVGRVGLEWLCVPASYRSACIWDCTVYVCVCVCVRACVYVTHK